MYSYGTPYYYHSAYWNRTPYFDYRNHTTIPYNFSVSQYNSYPYFFGNQTNVSFRQESESFNCQYVGNISPDGKRASGTYKCANGGSGTWSGTIIQDDKEPLDEALDEALPISEELSIFGGKAKVRVSFYPDLNRIQLEGFILGQRVINQTVTLEGTTEIVDKKTVAGVTTKFVYGLNPGQRLVYVRAELRVGGRVIARLPVTTILRW
ncbi:hypothetical protein [Bacillus bingmayongensis]|uniref:hypothetical protein n=1 Tax=Bacillus bingmayongensis TaxID=1150157 RepID=UPI001C8D9663|nr:hypothetical protein [Bacillus bingmayongensis]MBY0597016.1 hypothetical protein [Bacillus bingmayongensis]